MIEDRLDERIRTACEYLQPPTGLARFWYLISRAELLRDEFFGPVGQIHRNNNFFCK